MDASGGGSVDVVKALLEKGDADKIWSMLDSKSQADAEAVAKTIQTAYVKASPEEKAALEKTQGLTSDELSQLTGKTVLAKQRDRFLPLRYKTPIAQPHEEVQDSWGTRENLDGFEIRWNRMR